MKRIYTTLFLVVGLMSPVFVSPVFASIHSEGVPITKEKRHERESRIRNLDHKISLHASYGDILGRELDRLEAVSTTYGDTLGRELDKLEAVRTAGHQQLYEKAMTLREELSGAKLSKRFKFDEWNKLRSTTGRLEDFEKVESQIAALKENIEDVEALQEKARAIMVEFKDIKTPEPVAERHIPQQPPLQRQFVSTPSSTSSSAPVTDGGVQKKVASQSVGYHPFYLTGTSVIGAILIPAILYRWYKKRKAAEKEKLEQELLEEGDEGLDTGALGVGEKQ